MITWRKVDYPKIVIYEPKADGKGIESIQIERDGDNYKLKIDFSSKEKAKEFRSDADKNSYELTITSNDADKVIEALNKITPFDDSTLSSISLLLKGAAPSSAATVEETTNTLTSNTTNTTNSNKDTGTSLFWKPKVATEVKGQGQDKDEIKEQEEPSTPKKKM